MSWTYSGNPETSDKDEVRFLLGDTASDQPQVSDEEILYALARLKPIYDDPLMAAAYLADAIAANYVGEGSISADGVTVSLAEIAGRYRDLGARLRAMHNQIQGAAGAPVFTGAPEVGTRSKVFGRGSMDNPNAGRQELGDLAPWPAPPDGGYWVPA